jgi:Recombination endonuclease VII
MSSHCAAVPKEDTGNAKTPERKLAYQRRYYECRRDEINERRRHNRQTDSAYRERALAVQRDYYQRHKEEVKERSRRRWRTDAAYREKKLVRTREYQREKRFREIYGITVADHEAMFARQDGACAICKRTGVPLCVDHCHRTGEVRSLLCRRCNRGLGFYNDDPDILLVAVAYLRTWRDQQRGAQGTDPPIEPISQGRPEGPIGQPCDSSVTAHNQVHARTTVASCPADRARNIVADAAKSYESDVT